MIIIIMRDVKIRKQVLQRIPKKFRGTVPLALALIIDAVDIVPNFLSLILSATGIGIPVGITLDAGTDLIQGALASLVFEDPKIWAIGTGIELSLPPGLDFIPSYTGFVLATQLGILK